MDNDQLLEKVEKIKSICLDVATGGNLGEKDQDEFKAIRRTLKDSLNNEILPDFIINCTTLDEFWFFIKPKYVHYAERREFLRNEFNPLIQHLETPQSRIKEKYQEKIKNYTPEIIHEYWEKSLRRLKQNDFEGAITTSRTFLEGVFKFILDERHITYEDNLEFHKLYQAVAETLNLKPKQHDEAIFRQILDGCQKVIDGMGSLRNTKGDAHFSKNYKPHKRHAELAVSLSASLSTFLIETLNARKEENTAISNSNERTT